MVFYGTVILVTVLQLSSALEAEITQVVNVRNKSFSCLFKIHYEDDTCYDNSTVSCSPHGKKEKMARNVELVLENGAVIKIKKLKIRKEGQRRKKDKIIGCKATSTAIPNTTESTHVSSTSTTIHTTFGTTTPRTTTGSYPGVLLVLGGQGNPKVTVTKNGKLCDSVKIADVPQHYGEPGRTGSYSTSWDKTAMVCGGYTGTGPPFSTFKDCQILDLVTKTWSLGPNLVNLTASRASVQLDDSFYIFGGSYPANPRPGPTQWRDHDVIQVLDLNNLDGGWRVEKQIVNYEDPANPCGGSSRTCVAVPDQFFPTC